MSDHPPPADASEIDGVGSALIAMAEGPPRQQLADALELAGFRCRLVSSGLYALTTLERARPTLVVCGQTLDDMPGHDLLDIVRSDDALCEVGFVLLQGEDGAGVSPTERDVVLGPSASTDEIVRASLLLGDPIDTAEPFGELHNVLLSGSLEVFDLGGLLMLLRAGRKCGQLHLLAQGERSLVVFVKGRLIHAEAGGEVGEDALAYLWPRLFNDRSVQFAFEGLRASALTHHPVTITRTLETILLHLSVVYDEQLEGKNHG